MRILFYFPTSQSSVSLETLMEEFQKLGHQIFLLGTEEKGDIHETVESFGVKSSVFIVPRSPSILYYVRHIKYLRQFIRKNNIDLVYAHTQPANFIAAFAQYLVKARVILCRHHSDYIMKGSNKNAKVFDKVINFLGKEFIVPSIKVFDQLTKVEGISSKKVRLIPYAYRFERYPQPFPDSVQEIRSEFKTAILLCTVSRFIPCKRHDVLVKCLDEVASRGFDVRLLLLGEGPLKKQVESIVSQLENKDRVHFLGFRKNVIDYLEASDVLVHFSDSEASNNVVKEAGLRKKVVAVCNHVGDFGEYIVNNENGVLLSKMDPCSDFLKFVSDYAESRRSYENMGAKLERSVLEKYHVDHVLGSYSEVLT